MEGTNRKEMRKLLNKCCALMKVAFDGHLNFSIYTRLNLDEDRPWFTGYAWEEGASFTKDDGRCFLSFEIYEHRSVEENLAILAKVEKFIENHKK